MPLSFSRSLVVGPLARDHQIVVIPDMVDYATGWSDSEGLRFCLVRSSLVE